MVMQKIPQLAALKTSFACIIAAIIASDEIVSDQEQRQAEHFFAEEFGIDAEATATLLEQAQEGDVDKHLLLLQEAFAGNMIEKARFMQFLNACITSDGVDSREYRVFEKVRDAFFG